MSEAGSGFLAELKRRRVFRVVGMYAVASFVLLQVGDVAFDPLGLPPGSQRLLIVLLALGFPLVLVLAWVFDITPDGIVRTDDVKITAVAQSIGWSNRRVDWTIIALLVAVIAYLIWDPDLLGRSQSAAEPDG